MAVTGTERIKKFWQITRALVIVLVLNWGVAAAKIVFGLFANFSSMVADGFHSLADGTSNIIGLIGIAISYQPVDKYHPYGHKKYETLFALGIAALLFIISFNLFREGLARMFHPRVPNIHPVSFVVMLVTLAINFLVVRYEYGRGRHLHSDILVADSLHTRADIFTSISVICALIASKLGFPMVDPIVTMGISLFIAYAGYDIIRDNSRVLCDRAVIPDGKKIEDIVKEVRGTCGCHRIRTRGREDDIHIDLHVMVAAGMRVDEAHRIGEEVEKAIKKDIPGATDVVVHLEPKESCCCR
jgi:cation diffusion facilitator family transporter